MPVYEQHVFVCTRGEWCPSVDGDGIGVHAALKQAVREAGLSGTVRVNHSGCFSQCGNGPMAVVYPKGIWYAALTPADAGEIVSEHLMGARQSSACNTSQKPWVRTSSSAKRTGARSVAAHPGRRVASGEHAALTEGPPPEIHALLRERSEARADRDWERADALRDRMRELGWEAVDSPKRSVARPLLADASSAAGYADDTDLASILDRDAEIASSLVVVVDDHPADLARFAEALTRHPQEVEYELVVVANAPAGGQPPLADATVLTLRERVGWADAVNLGLRRSRGAFVVLLDTSVEPDGPFLAPLLAAFEDQRVGIAGPWGVTSADGRQFEEAPPGEVDAVEGYCLALRRAALRAVGGFDHRFRFYRNADLDLSFATRAQGWTAVRTGPLPLIRHEHRGWSEQPDDERDRLSRRNFYRFLKHWGDRRDLLLHPATQRQ
jgi:(2Fe-2S) ferredoxin/GT2 family glycosyltransferase